MPGIAIVRSALESTSTPAASPSSSDIAMVRVDASSAPFVAAEAAAAGVPALREVSASAPASAAMLPSAMPTLPAGAAAPRTAVRMPSSTTTLPPGVPTSVPASFSQPLERPAGRRSPLVLLLALAVVGAAVGVGVYISLDGPASESETKLAPVEVQVGGVSSCEQLAALTGSWVFTTATTGARRKERLGVRGFYQVQITADGCTAQASIAKTGRTDRTVFEEGKIPRAEAELAQGEGFEGYGWAATFVLRNEDGQGIDTRFVFARDGDRLVGNWRQLGERWTSSGLYGVLEGRRDGDPVAILPERSTQPCAVRCATPEDIGQLDAPSQPAHVACMAACK